MKVQADLFEGPPVFSFIYAAQIGTTAEKQASIEKNKMKYYLLIEKNVYLLLCNSRKTANMFQTELRTLLYDIMRTFRILSTAALLSAMALQGLHAQQNTLSNTDIAPFEDGKVIRYCSEDITNGISLNKESDVKVYIEVSESIAKQLEGNKITAIGYGLFSRQDFTGISDVVVVVSEDMKRNKARQVSSGVTPGWHEVELSTPYTIEGKKFYIGYQGKMRTGVMAVGCSANGNPNVNHFFIGDEEEKWPYDDLSIAIYARTEGDKIITIPDVAVEKISVTPIADNGGEVEVKAKVINYGAIPFSGVKVACGFEGAQAEEQTIDKQMPVAGDPEEVTFRLKTDAGYASYKTVTLEASAGEDENMADNSLSYSVLAYNSQEPMNVLSAPKKVLVEEFTTQKCPNCPAGHVNVKAALDGRTDIVEVAHHSGYFTDKYTTDGSVETAKALFNSTTTFAPGIVMDRTKVQDYSTADGLVFVPGAPDYIISNLEMCKTPSFASVDIRKQYNRETRELKVFVEGYFIVRGVEPRLTVVLTENGMKSDGQSGYDGEYTYDHTVRAFLTPAKGEVLNVEDNHFQWAATYVIPEKITSSYDASYETTYEVETNPDNMNIVAFVSSYDENDIERCRVFNVDEYAVNGEDLGVEGTSADASVRVYALNGEVVLEGDITAAEIYSVDGRQVAVLGGAGAVALPQGIYVVKAQADNGSFTRKVVVK